MWKIRLVSNSCDARRTAAGPWFRSFNAQDRDRPHDLGRGHGPLSQRRRGLACHRAPRRRCAARAGANYGTGVLCKLVRARLGDRRDRHPGWERAADTEQRVPRWLQGGSLGRRNGPGVLMAWPGQSSPLRAEHVAPLSSPFLFQNEEIRRRETACPRGPSRLACVTL